MKTATILERIWQIDNYTFGIHWSDGTDSHYNLSELQKHCPCAGCREIDIEKSNHNKEVKAYRITSVGRYALRIEYTSGCSAGIYDYDLLRLLGEKL